MEALDKIRSGISHYCAFCYKEYEEEKVPKLCPCGHGDIRSMEELVPLKVLKEYKEQQELLKKKFDAKKGRPILPEDWGLDDEGASRSSGGYLGYTPIENGPKFVPSLRVCNFCKSGFVMFKRRLSTIEATEYYCAHCNTGEMVTDEGEVPDETNKCDGS